MDDRITYDDEGNPMVVKSRPPRPGKSRKSFSGTPDNHVEDCNTQTKQQKNNANGIKLCKSIIKQNIACIMI